MRDWDHYVIPGTSTLRNRLTDAENPDGVEDPERFRSLETRLSHIRIVETVADFPAGSFDYDHMKSVHRRLFRDVYEWAGHERVGPPHPSFVSRPTPSTTARVTRRRRS